MKQQEQWKPIPGYDGYEVSDQGRVRSFWKQAGRPQDGGWVLMDNPQRMMSTRGRRGSRDYPTVCIKGVYEYVHRLVMLAFVGPCPEGLVVCHNDDNPKNNRLENLRYDTQQANVDDAVASGSMGPGRKRQLENWQIIQMRRLAANGASGSELAKQFGVSRRTVSRICNGHVHTDIGGPIVDRLPNRPIKLVPMEIAMICGKLAAGEKSQADIAREHGVSPSMVSKIASRQRHAFVKAW